jgi:DinB superfamily
MKIKDTVSTELTPEHVEQVKGILADTEELILRLSTGMSEDQLRRPMGKGERSFVETLAHILHCESRNTEAITLALLVKEPAIVRVHAERDFGNLMRYDLWSFADLMAYFRIRRAALLRVLDSLKPTQWARVIVEAGKARKESVYWLVRGQATHELEHLDDLEKKLTKK